MGGTIPWPGVAKLKKMNVSGQAVCLHGVYLWVPAMASVNDELSFGSVSQTSPFLL